MSADQTSFILTAALDAQSQAWLDDLRERHFPTDRNFLKAHLTLFHRLSPAQKSQLETMSLPEAQVPVRFGSLRLLGYGVAVDVDSPPLLQFRNELARDMTGEITKQDQQKFRPHVTVQNKVKPEVARELYRALVADFEPCEGAVTGLQVWRYLGGPWELATQRGFD